MRRTVALLFVGAAELVLFASAQTPTSQGQQAARPPETVWREVQLVSRFDRDGDKQLNTEERQAAREYLGAHPELRDTVRRGRNMGPGSAGRRLSPSDVQPFSSKTPLYDPQALRTLFLDFGIPEWEQELAAFWHTDVELPATLTVDGVKYPDVGVHMRGHNSFLGVPEGRKRSLTIAIDFIRPSQRLLGYRGLHLLNAYQDPTFLRSALYLRIIREYMPATLANFVRVVINGESWGVYVNQQRTDSDFLRDAFKTTAGTRWRALNNAQGAGLSYPGDDVRAYRDAYEIKSRDNPAAWAALINVCKVLDETPPSRLSQALAPILDVDGALKFLALDNAVQNGDGYWEDGSDYDLYLDPQGRLHLVHYDTNEALLPIGGARASGPGRGVELDPFANAADPHKALIGKLLSAPDLRSRYLGYIRDIAERWLDWQTLAPIVKQYQAVIGDEVARDTRKLFPTEQFVIGIYGDPASPPPSIATLKGFLDGRRAFLLNHPEVKNAIIPR